jgi:hypothetical protein
MMYILHVLLGPPGVYGSGFTMPCILPGGMQACPTNPGSVGCNVTGGGLVCLPTGSSCSAAASITVANTPGCSFGPCVPTSGGSCPSYQPVGCWVNDATIMMCFTTGTSCPDSASNYPTNGMCSSTTGGPPMYGGGPPSYGGGELLLMERSIHFF